MEIKIINFEKREKKFVSNAINSVFIENLLDEKKIVFSDKLINKIINNAKIKIIISDNIRIGVILSINKINFLFLLEFSYINNLVNISNLKKLKIINNNLSKLQILNYFKFRIEKENLSNIPLIKSKKLLSEKINNSHKKILILGPKARNKNIINFLENEGNSVYCSLDKYFYKNMCLEKIDIIISSGYAYLIPIEVIERFQNRVFNLHASFLPWGKGIGTLFFSMLRFEPLGLSIHLIDKNFDTGSLICRKLLKPRIKDSTRSYYIYSLKKLDHYFMKSWKYIKLGQFMIFDQKKQNLI